MLIDELLMKVVYFRITGQLNHLRSTRKVYNFIQEPDEDLKCAICSNLADEPQQHECGQLICKECVENHGKDEPYPCCKTKGGLLFPDKRGKSETIIRCDVTFFN